MLPSAATNAGDPWGEPPSAVSPPKGCCRAIDPPVGGTFWFQIFIQAPSPEIWSETISGGEEVLAGKWGGLFLGYLLRKKFIDSHGVNGATAGNASGLQAATDRRCCTVT
jgi:hypothetical protein